MYSVTSDLVNLDLESEDLSTRPVSAVRQFSLFSHGALPGGVKRDSLMRFFVPMSPGQALLYIYVNVHKACTVYCIPKRINKTKRPWQLR